MEVLLPKAGMIEKKKKNKQDSDYTCSALPQSLLHAPRGHGGVLHRPDQTRSDQSFSTPKKMQSSLWRKRSNIIERKVLEKLTAAILGYFSDGRIRRRAGIN
jgi:hypothetical protein